MKNEDKKLDFEERYKNFKEKGGAAPILHKTVKFKVNENEKQVILSLEEMDSDGEVVEIAGCRMRNKDSIPMIDSHNSWGSVTENGLGAIRDPQITVVDGKPALVGTPDFAPTPNGDIAKILYMGVEGGKPYFTDVSMGFMVYDYDNETKHIKSWEVFELSLVTAGANRGARFVDKKLKGDGEIEALAEDLKIVKDLTRFKQIHKPFKEFTKLFLSEEFCKKINYTKDGDLSIDINAIHDRIITEFERVKVAPIIQQVAPIQIKQTADVVDIKDLEMVIIDALTKRLSL